MKTCAKCGKMVANSTPSCPQCGCFLFHTENGTDGMVSEILYMILQKSPKAFFIVIGAIVVIFIAFIIWFNFG